MFLSRILTKVIGLSVVLTLSLSPVWGEETAKEKKEKPAELETWTVTATKIEGDPDTVPVTVHSIGRNEIESQPNHYMNNYGELIRDMPGVHVAQYYPWGPPWVHLRGTGYFIGRTVFLVDGIPVTPFMSQTLSNEDIERVDVLLGPSSALYGANASGGAVNLITKKGRKDTGAGVKAGYGTFNTYRPGFYVGDKTGNWHYYLSYNGDYSNGYKMKPVEGMVDLYRRGKTQYLYDASLEDNKYRYSYFMGKVGYENAQGLGFTGTYNLEQLYLYGGQPDMILNNNGTQGIASFKFFTPMGEWVKITATAGYQHFDRPQLYIKGLSLVNNQVVLNTTPTTRSEWKNERTPLEVQSDFQLGRNNILTAGVSFSREKEVREDYNRLTGVRTSKTDYTTDQTALYLQDQMFLLNNKLSLLGGIRFDKWKFYDVFDQASTPQRPDPIEKDIITYRGGAKYRFNENFALKSSAGTAYWPGTALWFYRNVKSGMTWREANPNLKPEKTWMADLGGELTFPAYGTLLTATAYFGEIKDMVSYRYDVNPAVSGGTIIRTQNLGRAEIYGIEFLLRQRLTKELSLFGALTLNHSRLLDSEANTGHQLRNAPDYWGSLGLRFLKPEWVNAELLFRFSADRYYDDENTDLPYFHMEAYQTVDLKFWRDFKLSDKWVLKASLSGINLFDKKYATEIVYVNPGRYIMTDLKLVYRF